MIAALRRVPPLESVLVVAAFAVLVAIGVLNGERERAAVPALDSYSTFDSAGGGYRAFYELLQREGIPVDRFQLRPAFLSAEIGTLVYAEPLSFDPDQQLLTAGDIGSLESWVRSGGRLLYFGHDDVAAKRGILGLPSSVVTSSARSGAKTKSAVAPVAPAGIGSLGVAGALRWAAGHGKRVLYADRRGAVAVSYPFGKGRVIAVIDESLLQNDRIGQGDAARFAVALAGAAGPGSVFFDEAAHGHGLPLHWWAIVPRPFLYALAGAAAVLLIAFAGAAVRLGPPLVPPERNDRTSADFIDALSNLISRGGAIRKALGDASSSTARMLARALGLDDRASNEEIAARIERADLRAAFVEMLTVANNGFPDERNLVRGVALAQRLRKEYAAHGRQRY